LHGCYVRQLPATLWCHAQLEEPDARRHLDEMGRWLETRLRGRDLLLLGFWTDWGYLNSALETCVSAAEPASVTLVALDDEATLKAKAPSLWEWASRRPNFKPVSMDAAEFLVELRRQFGLLFRRLLLETGRATAASHYGIPPTAYPEPAESTAKDLYAFRQDACGVSRLSIPQIPRPDSSMELLGAVHVKLLALGAVLAGSDYVCCGRRVRVINGAGQLLSRVRARVAVGEEPPGEVTIFCVGAADDGGAPADLVREGQDVTVVRAAATARWLTEAALQDPEWN